MTEPEIRNTAIDRAAIKMLLKQFPEVQGIDPHLAPVAVLNDVWDRMARVLAALPEDQFRLVEEAIAPMAIPSEVNGDPSPPRTPQARARELLGLIIEWRHATWEAAEIAAGRDPHQVVAKA
jgi:hypothetical protein